MHGLGNAGKRRVGDGLGLAHGLDLGFVLHLAKLLHKAAQFDQLGFRLFSQGLLELTELRQSERVLYADAKRCACAVPRKATDGAGKKRRMRHARAVDADAGTLRAVLQGVEIARIGMQRAIGGGQHHGMSRLIIEHALEPGKPGHVREAPHVQDVKAGFRHRSAKRS